MVSLKELMLREEDGKNKEVTDVESDERDKKEDDERDKRDDDDIEIRGACP